MCIFVFFVAVFLTYKVRESLSFKRQFLVKKCAICCFFQQTPILKGANILQFQYFLLLLQQILRSSEQTITTGVTYITPPITNHN